MSAQETMGCGAEIAERLGDLVLFFCKIRLFLANRGFLANSVRFSLCFLRRRYIQSYLRLFKHVIIIALIFNAV